MTAIATCIVLCFGNADGPREDDAAYREQQQAVFEIERLGGKVLYDFHRTKNSGRQNIFNPRAIPKDPNTVHWVVYVSFRGTKVTNRDLVHLRKLPRLENLDLTETRVTSAGLENIRDATHLVYLGLWNTKVGDMGLEHIKHLKNLRALVLDGTKVTDEGLERLSELTNLDDWLGLCGTAVTDSGLKHLTNLRHLHHLNLRRTDVTELGVQGLKMHLKDADISFGP